MDFTKLREAEIRREIALDGISQQKFLQDLMVKVESGSSSYGRAQLLLTQYHEKVQEQLRAVIKVRKGKVRKWTEFLDTQRAAFIALDCCMRECIPKGGEVNNTTLALAIGRAWQFEENVQHLLKMSPLDYENVERTTVRVRRNTRLRETYRKILGEAEARRSKSELMQWGHYGIAAMWQAGFVDLPPQRHRREVRKVVIVPEILDFLVDIGNRDVGHVWDRMEGRMLAPPDPYTNPVDGGYLTQSRKARTPLLRLSGLRPEKRKQVLKNFSAENNPRVFAAVNFLQSVPYEIHEPTRQAILQVWAAGGGVLGVPRTKYPDAPPWPFGEQGKPQDELGLRLFQEWKLSTALHHKAKETWAKQLREVKELLRTSRNTAVPLWFPMYVDYRGRMYYRGYPNPQGTDMAKGVLHFWNKKPLGQRGLYWLKVHIANSFGYDKERMDDRVAWVDQNWEGIERALDAPHDYPEALGDSPWSTFSAAWELREAYRSGDPESYVTGLPVGMDATCSGLQHYSALLKDAEGGEMVNLTNGEGHGPKHDIYSRVAEWAMERIAHDALQEAPERAVRARWWLGKGVTRAMAKKPVMTFCYSATVRSAAEHVFACMLEDFKVTGDTWRKQGEGFRDCLYLGEILFAGIREMFPKAAQAMKWLQRMAKYNGDKPMEWTTPSGFPVVQDIRKSSMKIVDIRSSKLTFTVWEPTDEIDLHSTLNAVAPNFVHSLDSAHMGLVAVAMKERGCELLAIHDCASTHACDVDSMQEIIRRVFYEMYTEKDIMVDFKEQVAPEFTEDPPVQGTLELSKLLNSEFFFS